MDTPRRVVANPNFNAAPRGQNKMLAVEDTKKMSNERNSLSTSNIGFYNSNQAVTICGLAKSNSDVAFERIQSDLKQFTEEQRQRPLKVILGSTEQAKVLRKTTDIRVKLGNSVFFHRDYHPKER